MIFHLQEKDSSIYSLLTSSKGKEEEEWVMKEIIKENCGGEAQMGRLSILPKAQNSHPT